MKIINFLLSTLTVLSLTGIDVRAESVSYGSGTAEVSINEEMFEQNSNGYHKNIAVLSSVLSQCAYNGENLNNAYETLGFDTKNDVTLFGYADQSNNAVYDTDFIDFEEDSQAFSLATREIGDTRLLVVTLRGTNLESASDLLTDIAIFGTPFYEDSASTGFVSFFTKVSVGMSLYLNEHPEIEESAGNGKLKILITGHSLGGAGTNLLGAYFNTHGQVKYDSFSYIDSVAEMYEEKLDVPQEDIFVYSFACPNVYYGDPTTADCDNIMNIVNESDIIPKVPDGEKFGQFIYFDSDDSNGFSAHYGYKYINATENEIPDGVRYYGGAVDTEITENMFRQDSGEYHRDIAEIAIALSASAYNGRRDAGYYINSAYRQLGFKSDNIEIYGYPSEDYSFSIATRTVGDITLLAITLKGNSGQSDFYNQIKKPFSQPFMNTMTNPDYYYFYIRVKNSLDGYISQHSEILNSAQDGNLKVLVTGHSIGGAVASLLGNEINSPDSVLKIPEEDVFVYTFGSPCVYDSAMPCKNIMNIMNESDIVTLEPFGVKSGKTVTFDYGTFGKACYEPQIYIENLPEKPEYRTYTKITINNPYAEYTIQKDDTVLNDLKKFSDDEHTHIYLSSDDCSVKFTGSTEEIIEMSVSDTDGFKKSYENVLLTDGKNIEYDMKSAEMYVNDDNGNHIMTISTDGTETEIQKDTNLIPVMAGAGGAIILIATSATLMKRRKKGE
ncbi:MAG: hypothetical protein K2J36_06480 [Ruminococcus sp.]|nr:hypothetical protein [Ruminococcus sp.]